MRFYLDTNILIFSTMNPGELSRDTREILNDYSNILLTSDVCIHEFIHLAQIGKLGKGKHDIEPNAVLKIISDAGIEMIQVSRLHLRQFAALPFHGDHRDPNDRLIIAQAISDHIPLISSDGNFSDYIGDGLEFIYNER